MAQKTVTPDKSEDLNHTITGDDKPGGKPAYVVGAELIALKPNVPLWIHDIAEQIIDAHKSGTVPKKIEIGYAYMRELRLISIPPRSSVSWWFFVKRVGKRWTMLGLPVSFIRANLTEDVNDEHQRFGVIC